MEIEQSEIPEIPEEIEEEISIQAPKKKRKGLTLSVKNEKTNYEKQ